MSKKSTVAIILIVVAVGGLFVLGIVAAVAIPAFLSYTRESKTAEAEQNLKAITDGALSYFSREHVESGASPVPGGGEAVVTHIFPLSPEPTCTSSGGEPEKKSMPKAADYREGVFRSLRFKIGKPHHYRYCYQSFDEGSRFKAWAEASLGGEGIDSRFEVEGARQEDRPVASSVMEVE